MKKRCSLILLMTVAMIIASAGRSDAGKPISEKPSDPLPPGFVKGDVISYSYVPNRYWSLQEGIGKCPYLFEYGLMKLKDGTRLEEFHAENIRRIDLASQWSTAVMLYPRHPEYRDEIINLMIRCFKNRQLIILSDVWGREGEPYMKVRDILNKCWEHRDRPLTSPQGDKATGLQLINNILAIKLGDEGECGLGTKGLEKVYADFNQRVRYWERDGRKPFSHIRGWYNMIAYAGINYDGCWAGSQDDVDNHRRIKLPANTQCIGVDVYNYWFHKYSPFDPADLSIPREKVRAHAAEWHRLRTQYYPEGLQVRVCENPGDTKTWIPECWNDTHALMEAIKLAGADEAMMWYIALSSGLDNSLGNVTYTTPIETMDIYYENIKTGPWVALSWWVWEGWHDAQGTQQYVDRTLKHYTPEHPQGIPYSKQMLDYWHDEFIKSRKRMFNDVVYNQFGYLNGPAPSEEKLPSGYVRGDVVSYSYVPIRTWSPKEGVGILPYLFEYSLMAWNGKQPLEDFHAENIRRIDIAGKWSTAIGLYNRYDYFRDEIINLMIRCFKNRQLIILSATPNQKDPEKNAHKNLIEILDKLWENRDKTLVSPEGDRATGGQLINNILAAKLGDEGECGLRTEGLQKLFADFDRDIRLREKDGRRPFSHIKGWYNMLGYAAFDYHSCYAAGQEDVDKHNRVKLPPNTQAIGVDVYHYWFHKYSPFDPADLAIPRERIRAHSNEWQRIRTKYYPEGLQVRVCENSNDQKTWIPECWNDTHALMDGIEFAGAKSAMMWYIGVCGQLVDAGNETTYTTPIETMESYYDHIKAGPWVALSWWYFDAQSPKGQGGLDYYDKKLLHCTPEHPEGIPYSQQMLDYWHREYVAVKMRMFNDVVYNQFGYLNGPAAKKK